MKISKSNLTFDEWFDAGYRVKKGEKALTKNKGGKATFALSQVWFVPEKSREQYLNRATLNQPPVEIKKAIAEKEKIEEAKHNYIDPDFDPDEQILDEFEPPW